MPLVRLTRREALALTIGVAAATSTGGRTVAQGLLMSTPKRIVFVVSNQARAASNGMEIGYWLPELAHPYFAFQNRGYAITIASPQGGAIVHDKLSDPDGGRFANPRDLISLGFKTAKPTQEETAATKVLASIRPEDFDAIFVIGGLAPPTTFSNDEGLHQLFAAFYERGKVAAAICHGSLVLLKARLSNGRMLAEGKRWTGYTNAEEDVVDKAMSLRFQPYRIEDEARKLPGTFFVQGEPYRPFAVTDGRLITGQQGSSGMLTAEHVIRALES